MLPAAKTHLRETIGAVAAFVAGWIVYSPAAMASDAMPVSQQNALVQKYCAVCHTDAQRSGGLSLEHFDAVHPDPGVAAMMLGKLKTGAIGAAGLKRPDDATIQTWIRATSAEAAGANKWSVKRTEDSTTKARIISASIVEEVPSADNAGVPDSYRLTVTCRADTHEAAMELAWSPGVPKEDQPLAVFVDGRAVSGYKIGGPEPMGGGMAGSSGPGAVILYATGKDSGAAKFAMALPEHTLTIRDVFPNEVVVFPFGELTQTERLAISVCFPGTIASR
jgi:hypothetical protein